MAATHTHSGLTSQRCMKSEMASKMIGAWEALEVAVCSVSRCQMPSESLLLHTGTLTAAGDVFLVQTHSFVV